MLISASTHHKFKLQAAFGHEQGYLTRRVLAGIPFREWMKGCISTGSITTLSFDMFLKPSNSIVSLELQNNMRLINSELLQHLQSNRCNNKVIRLTPIFLSTELESFVNETQYIMYCQTARKKNT